MMFLFGKGKKAASDEEKLRRIESEAAEIRKENASGAETLRRIEEKTQRLEELPMEESRERTVLCENLSEMEHTQDRFLSLFFVYQEQFWQMKRFFEEREDSWAQQFSLMEEELSRSMDRCGITAVDSTGVTVDYELHEVVQAVDTDEIARDRRIAEILSPGYLYQGKVRKKAKAVVYRAVPK